MLNKTQKLKPDLKKTPLWDDKNNFQGSEMESTVFEVLMQSDAYRVDYLNSEKFGTPPSLAMFVLGSLLPGQPYSRKAKRYLQTGLLMIRQMNQLKNLVAIYVDIAKAVNSQRPAVQQLMRDGAAGIYRRLMIVCADNASEIHPHLPNWRKLLGDLSNCEIMFADLQGVWLVKRANHSLREGGWVEPAPVWMLE